MTTKSVSVIIPAYNESEGISECLETLKQQTLLPTEVIVVDDGSTDDTARIAKESGATVIIGQHKGPGVARNLGAETSTGEILVFLDADMSFHPEFLEKLVEPIGGEIKGTFSKEEYVANWDNPWARCWSINLELPGRKRHPANYPDEDGVFRAIGRDDFMSVGGYDDMGYSEDFSISRKLGALAVYAPGAICYHNNPSSLREVYLSARWFGRGDQARSTLGTMLDHSLPHTLRFGAIRAIRYRSPHYPVFKLVYDSGVVAGLLGKLIHPRSHMK